MPENIIPDNNQEESNQKNVKLNLEILKLEKENKKIKIDIDELEKVWWKKINWAPIIIPALATFATLAWGFANNVFDIKGDKVRNENTLLEIKKLKLDQEIKDSTASKNALVKKTIELTDTINYLKAIRDNFPSVVQEKRDSLEAYSRSISNYKAKIISLKKDSSLLQNYLIALQGDLNSVNKAFADLHKEKEVLSDSLSKTTWNYQNTLSALSMLRISMERQKTATGTARNDANTYFAMLKLWKEKYGTFVPAKD